MKRGGIFLIIGFLVLIAIGVTGIILMNRADAKNRTTERDDGGKVPSAGSGAAFHYDNLDHAIVPAGVKQQEKDYEGFRVSFNYDNATPNWVAWELLCDETEGSSSRKNRFWNDEYIKGCPMHYDYNGSGYDRGHLCPAGDQKWSEEAMEDCFVMANMAPQDHSLNAGAWNTLENKERTWARRDSALVIIAGPLYEKSDTRTIGDSEVRVPGAFYKVIIAPYLENPRGIGFIFPNMSAPGNLQNYSMTIDEVERITGFDFFHNLPDELEERIESQTSFKEWNRR